MKKIIDKFRQQEYSIKNASQILETCKKKSFEYERIC